MRTYASQRTLDVWYAHVTAQADVPELLDTLDKNSRKAFTRTIDKARTRDSLRSRRKLAEDGRRPAAPGQPTRRCSSQPRDSTSDPGRRRWRSGSRR